MVAVLHPRVSHSTRDGVTLTDGDPDTILCQHRRAAQPSYPRPDHNHLCLVRPASCSSAAWYWWCCCWCYSCFTTPWMCRPASLRIGSTAQVLEGTTLECKRLVVGLEMLFHHLKCNEFQSYFNRIAHCLLQDSLQHVAESLILGKVRAKSLQRAANTQGCELRLARQYQSSL